MSAKWWLAYEAFLNAIILFITDYHLQSLQKKGMRCYIDFGTLLKRLVILYRIIRSKSRIAR